MRKLIIFLLLFNHLTYGQGLQSFLTIATFNSNESPFLETYLYFNTNTLKLIKNNDNYYGEIDVYIIIKDDNSETIYQDHYLLKSPIFNKENNNIFFIDQQRIALGKGFYTINIQLFDINNKDIKKHSEKFNINYDLTSISSIQLIDNYSIAKEESILNKSGYALTPFISNYYPKSVDNLTYYFETYNTNLFDDQKYIINTYIESYETGVPLYNFNKVIRKVASEIESNLLSFDIKNLPTGNYNLVCKLKDSKNNEIYTSKLFFQRSNSFTYTNNYNDLNTISLQGKFVNNFTNKDSLRQFIDYLYPICSPQENTFAQNQLSYDNLELMLKFFYNFWESRNSLDPSSEWIKYYQEVKKVNKSFRNAKIKGYLTDRGRVYLQYGPPNSRNKVDNASSTYPYEIWHYYKLKNQTNKKFVFVNSDFATNEYRLEYSNVFGEVSNAEWRDRIEQDQTPTFGDDFNNNYINPK